MTRKKGLPAGRQGEHELMKKAEVPARKNKAKKALEKVRLFPGIKNPRQRAFLVAFVETGGIAKAAKLSGVSWSAHYQWKRDDAKYLAQFDLAMDMVADRAEAELHRRAIEGYDKPVTYKGEIRGWYKDFSDTCLIFMLKGMRPEKYRENMVQMTANAPTAIQIILSPEAPTKEEVLNASAEPADQSDDDGSSG